jgi:hypothetical protein
MANKKFLNPINLVNLSSDPSTASEGDIYYNTASDAVKVYANGAWVAIGAGGGSEITVSTTAPSSPTTGDAWYKNDTGEFYVYDGTYWVEVNGVIEGTNTFNTISVSGQSDVVADSSTDTLTLVAGTNVSITTNATNDSITINADSKSTSSVYLVRNNTESTILKGTLVSASGAEPSGRIDVEPFAAVGGINSELTVMGMATANISSGVNGEVISFGTLTGIDTRGNTASAIAVGDETWAEGDILFAHPTVAGKLTKVRPQHDLAVAFITVRHASTGQIAVRIVPGNNHLEWMHDVLIDGTPADNEVLAYDDFSGTWINQTSLEAGLLDTSATEQTKAGNLIITGNLTVNGTTTTINSTAINVNNQVIFEGSTPDDFETTLTSIDPTADNTISLPNSSGTIALQSGYTNDSVITIRSYDGITDGAINLEAYQNKIQLSDDNGVEITTGAGTKTFDFNNSGNIVFPDATSQSTAFLGMSSYSTTNLSEGTNLYFTDERAQDAIGNNLGSGLSYNDSTGAISNSGVLSIIGTTNEIDILGTNAEIQIGIPNSPVFVTPNIGVATATSVNGTTIPTSETLLITDDIGSTVQAHSTSLDEIDVLGSGAVFGGTAFLVNINGLEWAYDTNTYSTTSHNHSLDGLSNVVITGTPTDGQAIVWDTTTSKWVNETVSGGASYPTQSGNTGKFLQTDGSTVSWQNVDLSNYVTLTGTETLSGKSISDNLYFDNPSTSASANIRQDSTGTFTITTNDVLYLEGANSIVLLNGIPGSSGQYLGSINSNNQIAKIGDLSSFLTSESDTLETVTDRGATSTNVITISNTTQSTTPTTGALIISGGVGIAKDVWIDGDLHVNGSTATLFSRSLSTRDNLIYLNESSPTEITNAVGDGTYVTYTADNDYLPGESIRITGIDPAGYNISSGDLKTIYSATATEFVVEKTDTGTYVSGGDAYAKSAVNPDLGFAGGYNDGTYAHAGLFRDASDGVFKFFKGYTPEPDAAVNIDTAHASFSFAPIKVESLDVVDGSTTRTNLGLGTMATETASNYAPLASPTFTGTVTLPINVKFENGSNDLIIGSYPGKNRSVVFGYNAGSSLPVQGNADNIVAIGARAMATNNWGQYSVAVGSDALLGSGNQGSFNTAIGGNSLADLGGAGSLAQNVSNTAIGYNSGSAITNGGKNVVIGSNTGSTINGLSNNIIISDGDGNIRAQYLSADSGWTLGTISSGIWSGTTIEYTKGGTGLTTLGTAGQVLTVNSGATGLEWATPSGGGGGPSTTTTSISINTAVVIESFAISASRTAEAIIQITQGTDYYSSKVLLIHDGTNVKITEYAILESSAGAIPVTISAAISGSNVELRATITDAATTNATAKVIMTEVAV